MIAINTRKLRITTTDIAKHAGVSQATVSLILSGKPSMNFASETREKVWSSAIKLGYIQPTEPLFVEHDRDMDIAVIVPDIVNPSFSDLLSQVSNRCYENRINLIVCNTDRSPAVERYYMERFLARGVQGILYVCTPSCPDLIERARQKMPIVVMGDAASRLSVSNIAVDSNYSGRQLGKHLYQLGHRHVAYITPPINSVSTLREQRLLGLEGYYAEKGIADTFYVYEQTTYLPPTADPFEVTMGQIQTDKVLLEHPDVTAIVAQGDLIAVGVYNALRAAGVRVPEDISVASFDNIDYGRYLLPTLTSVDTKMSLRCRHAFDYLLQLIEGGEANWDDPLYVTYQSSLLVRDSTAEPRTEPLTLPAVSEEA